MAPITKYATLTDQELLSMLEPIKHRSPIILELCSRLEGKEELLIDNSTNHKAKCPICQADLWVEYNIGNNVFDITVPNA